MVWWSLRVVLPYLSGGRRWGYSVESGGCGWVCALHLLRMRRYGARSGFSGAIEVKGKCALAFFGLGRVRSLLLLLSSVVVGSRRSSSVVVVVVVVGQLQQAVVRRRSARLVRSLVRAAC
jgi:hypothetical protein